MFSQQQQILDAIPTLEQLCARYEWQTEPADWVQNAENKAQNFVIPVPLVGAFSSGKSSLVNAFLDRPVFSTNIDPETAVPAEISYSEVESFTGCLPDGQRIPLTREAVRANDLAILFPNGLVEAKLSTPELLKIPHLRLADMPGWESGIRDHSVALDNYTARSLAYGVVISAEEGNLRDTIRVALKELANKGMPVFAVITKIDKKLPEEAEQVMSLVEKEITNTMGRPPMKVIKASARKKEIKEFVAILQELELQAQPLFVINVVNPFIQKLQSLTQHIDILLRSDDLSSEKIMAECEKLQDDIKVFNIRLRDETTELENRIRPVLARIIQRLEVALQGELNDLSQRIISGGDWKGTLGNSTRLAVDQGMREEFMPQIQQYLDRVAEGLPEQFRPEISHHFEINSSNKDNSNFTAPVILTTLLPLLQTLPIALGPVAKLLVTAATALIGHFLSKKNNNEVAQAEQQEEIRKHLLHKIIPEVCQQVRDNLQPQLQAHVQTAKEKIAHNVQLQQASHEAALHQLEKQLESSKAEVAKAREQYQADQSYLQHLRQQLAA